MAYAVQPEYEHIAEELSLNLSVELGMVKKAAAMFAICASIAIGLGCTTTSNHILYAALPQSAQIVAYREDPNSGILTQLTISPITAGPAVQSLAVHPSGKYLYAANAGENDVSLFDIGLGGSLVEQGTRTQVGTSPTLLAMDSAGQYLYVANSGSENISVLSISSSSGTLSPVGQPFQVGISPLNMKISPSGSFLYVTGASSQVGAPGYIEVLSISSGTLAIVPPIIQPGANPYGLAITPDGNYLYTANFGDNTISEFTINNSGSATSSGVPPGGLAPLAGSPLGETYTGPVSLLVNTAQQYLYVANQQSSGNVAGYAIGTGASAGALSLLSSSPYPTGAQPSVIATDVSGNYVFVGNQSKPAIESFCLASKNLTCNSSTGIGSLTEVDTYPLGNAPTSIVISP
jgi:6-phosphogluconolactonase (cycloisomerase 2 family)